MAAHPRLVLGATMLYLLKQMEGRWIDVWYVKASPDIRALRRAEFSS